MKLLIFLLTIFGAISSIVGMEGFSRDSNNSNNNNDNDNDNDMALLAVARKKQLDQSVEAMMAKNLTALTATEKLTNNHSNSNKNYFTILPDDIINEVIAATLDEAAKNSITDGIVCWEAIMQSIKTLKLIDKNFCRLVSKTMDNELRAYLAKEFVETKAHQEELSQEEIACKYDVTVWVANRLKNDPDFVRNLISRHMYGGTFYAYPLMLAAKYNSLSTAKLLLNKGAEIEAEDAEASTALGYAARANSTTVARLLLAKGATQIDHALKLAIVMDSPDVAELLLENGALENDMLLLDAARTDSPEVVRLLLARGAHVNALDDSGNTPLMLAAANADEKVTLMALLIKNGADVNAKNSAEETALMRATSYDSSVNKVELLLEKDALVDARDARGRTALMYAAAQDSPDVIKLLLDHGAFINARDAKGRTALIHAAKNNSVSTADLLLDNEADKDIKDYKGKNVLNHAKGNAIQQYLVTVGAVDECVII